MNICPTTHKRAFGSRHAAHVAVRKLARRVRLYRCPSCGLWHVTTQRSHRRAA